ncbi:MAG: hypothetical protein RLZZ172_2219 [Bacteroidota bacterium]|jgi:hypothetical protein
MERQEQPQPIAPIRPRFLTFLCYLTIFASVYMMFSSFSGFFNPEALTKSTTLAMENWELAVEKMIQRDPQLKSSMDRMLADVYNANTNSNMRDYSFFNAICNLLTLIGAMLMLKLRRNGFRLYLLGILISFISPLLVFGTDNLLGQAFSVYYALSGGIFVLLYAFKIKFMQ